MRYVEVGGVRLSVIGLGTWQFGSREWGYGDEYAEREAGDITRRALDLGINMIDTAGVSNFSLRRWRDAEDALAGPVLSNQVEYSLVQRKPERELLPWAQAN